MNGPKLPAVRLPAVSGQDPIVQDAVVLDSDSPNGLIFSFVSEPRPNTSTSSLDHQFADEHGSQNSFSEGLAEAYMTGDATDSPMEDVNPEGDVLERSIPFSRILSMPLPSQLTQLQNPHRSGSQNMLSAVSNVPHNDTGEPSQYRELSVELADSIQLIIQTMLQISPPQVLDAAKEQFSACSLSIPTPSMSALFTAMKNLNYISANMEAFCLETPRLKQPGYIPELSPAPAIPNDFDIGEMLQSVGDALSGAAAQAGVDLVIYHGDVGLKHFIVSGDESGMSYVISHIVRQVLNTAESGDSIELGLLISPLSPFPPHFPLSTPLDPNDAAEATLPSSPMELDNPLQCTIRISHKYRTPETPRSESLSNGIEGERRPRPLFSTLLLRRLLRQVGATLTPDLPPPEAFTNGRTCDLNFSLRRGTSPSGDTSEKGGISEPTLKTLISFVESLKGRKVTLYASSKGSFAQHLTSYLTAWGMDITHISPDGNTDGIPDPPPKRAPNGDLVSGFPELSMHGLATMTSLSGTQIDEIRQQPQVGPQDLSFIVIDDDVDVLRERLEILREEQQPQPMNLNIRKRPSLAAHHRPRSSPQIARLLGQTSILRPAPVVIMHFTSLSNYKMIRDVFQSMIISYAASSTSLPEVMIIPKPAGPRRFLTALHTAVTKPMVDPFFTPIATSPTSPGLQNHGSFFHPMSEQAGPSGSQNQPTPNKSNRPLGTRSNSDRSTKSGKDLMEVSLPPVSPLRPEGVEYFSEAAVKLGSSPSTGLVIQSPDGQPAGIFFHPRGKTSRNPSSQSMERDKGQFYLTSTKRGTPSRLPSASKSENMSFSILHETAVSTQIPPTLVGAKAQNAPEPSPTILTSPNTLRGKTASSPPRPEEIPTQPKLSPVLARKISITPSSPEEVTPSRRSLGKRLAYESTSASSSSIPNNKKVLSASDGNIVPPISVLIVEDNPINQTILLTFMKKKKIKYDVANNGQEAVEKWKTGEFHLILMDIQMPVMDGIQATKEIRRLEKLNAKAGYPPFTPSDENRTPPLHTPSDSCNSTETRSVSSPYRSSVIIVALTASSLQSDRVAALAAGCNDFLTKPVTLDWLNNKIIEWGSIKALQMWADVRPDAVKTMTTGQAAQARSVAQRLHVPKERGASTPGRRSLTKANLSSMQNQQSSSSSSNQQITSPVSGSFMIGGGNWTNDSLSGTASSSSFAWDSRRPLKNCVTPSPMPVIRTNSSDSPPSSDVEQSSTTRPFFKHNENSESLDSDIPFNKPLTASSTPFSIVPSGHKTHNKLPSPAVREAELRKAIEPSSTSSSSNSNNTSP